MPTKIACEIAAAFKAGRRKMGNNTFTDGQRVRYHRSDIAWTDQHGVVWLSNCGYATPTTHDRLNAICAAFDADFRFCRKNWDTRLWYWRDNRYEPYTGKIPLVGPLGRLALAA